MKIHAMCLVKNESDIIAQTLIAATSWCDFIYVFDNGSTDTTWEKVLSLSKSYEQIIPYKQDNCPFDDSLRSQMFNHYRATFNDGDWCSRLDADEIYIDDPRLFLAKVPAKYEVVCAAMFNYYFTDKDLERYKKEPSLYADDVPVEQKCRYYQNKFSEIRFFRYRKDLVWREKAECLIWSDYKDWPLSLTGDAYPVRIWLKNYQYRSPQQIQKRIDTRRGLTSRGLFPQEMEYQWTQWQKFTTNVLSEDRFWSWKSRIVEADTLDYDAHDRRFILREDLMPDMNKILISYDIKKTPRNLIRRLARRGKRKLVQLGLLSNPLKQESKESAPI
ncbi:MAG TPA: glycosyltransferase family 2 protein [Oculatellaceae cyanobacterium]